MTQKEREGNQADSEVKITDRRLFTADGDLRSGAVVDDGADEDPQEPPSSVQPETPRSEPSSPGPEFERRPLEEPQGVDFTMLINAMAEPALLFLGEIAHPSTGQPTVDLERARFQIDMLELLRVKCRGNMTPDEEGLLDRVLYQLRMLYVARANQPEQP